MKKNYIFLFILVLSNIVYAQFPFIQHGFTTNDGNPYMNERIEFADMDNDGDKDLINFLETKIIIYPNNGTTIDSTNYTIIDFYNWRSHIVDWNNDGLPDLIDAYNSSPQIKFNLGNMVFSALQTITANNSNHNFNTKDFNSDGWIDFYTHNGSTGGTIFMNQTGSLIPTSQYFTIEDEYNINGWIDFEDVNNDGIWELFYNKQGGTGNIYIYTHSGNFNYYKVDSIITTYPPSSIKTFQFFDINNDGKNELISVSNPPLNYKINIFENTLGFSYNNVFTGDYTHFYPGGVVFSFNPRPISEFYDVDNNGLDDIIVGSSVFFNFSNSSSFNFTETEITDKPSYYPQYFKCADINGNGKTNITYVHNVATYLNSITFGLYQVEYTSGTSLASPDIFWNFYNSDIAYAQITDFDLDGDLDLLEPTNGNMIFLENINGILYPTPLSVPNLTSSYAEFSIVDINGDNYEDIIFRNNDDHYYYFNNQGNGFIYGDKFASLALSTNVLHIEDIDNNGKEEVFMAKTPSSGNGSISMYTTNNNTLEHIGTIATWFATGTNPNPQIKIADFDNDGIKDIVSLYNVTGSSKTHFLHHNGDLTTTESYLLSSGCTGFLGMYDTNGDGLLDFHCHDNRQYIFRTLNNDDGTFNSIEWFDTLSTSMNNMLSISTDINDDVIEDLIIYDNNFSYVLKNIPSGFNHLYSQNFSTIDYSIPNYNRKKDIDNDGDDDLLCGSLWYENIGINQFSVKGFVYYDIDENGIFSQGIDLPFSSFPIKLDNGNYTSYTVNSGVFEIPVGNTPGIHNFSIGEGFESVYTATSSPYPSQVSVSLLNPTDSIIIGITNPLGITSGEIDATLSAHRCNEPARLFLSLKSLSPETVNAQLKVKIATNSSFINSNLSNTIILDTVIWNIPNITNFTPKLIYADLVMPGTQFMGDTLTFYSELRLTDSFGTTTVRDTLTDILTCAYDPNDKNILLNKDIYILDSIYSFRDETEYLIRFQNTGNDTAKTVVIKDYISSLFDLTSIKPISGSSNYSFQIDHGTREVTVTFNNINLPDSGTDFIGSMGYIKFGINYNSSSPTFVPIHNTVGIYFDQNPAVYTNTHEFFRVNCSDFLELSYDTTSFCAPGNITFYNNDYNLPFEYLWNLDTMTTNDIGFSEFNFPTSGTYNLNLEIANPSCNANTDSIITISYDHPPDLILFNQDTTICPGEYLAISANQNCYWNFYGSFFDGGSSYNLSFDGGEHTVSAFYVNNIGCSSDTASFNISVKELEYPLHNYDIGNGYTYLNPVCDSDSIITITSNYGDLYWEVFNDLDSLDFTDTSSFISFNTYPYWNSDIYIIATLDTMGCTFTHEVFIELWYNDNLYIENVNGFTPYYQDYFICSPDTSAQLYSNRFVDWYLDSVFMTNDLAININQSGSYMAIDECNDWVAYDYFFNEPLVLNDTISICPQGSYTFPDGDIVDLTYQANNTISHTSYLQSSSTFCDSTIITTLNIKPNNSSSIDYGICYNANFTYLDGTVSNEIKANESHSSVLSNASSNGCDSTITENIFVTIINTSVSHNTDSLVATETGATYQWLDCNNSYINGENNRHFTPSTSGNYAVEITKNGCIDTSYCFPFIPLTIATNNFAKELNIYPNPNNGDFIINLGKPYKNVDITIFDIYGNIIKNITTNNEQLIELKIDATSGVYLLRIIHEKQNSITRIIKQ